MLGLAQLHLNSTQLNVNTDTVHTSNGLMMSLRKWINQSEKTEKAKGCWMLDVGWRESKSEMKKGTAEPMNKLFCFREIDFQIF